MYNESWKIPRFVTRYRHTIRSASQNAELTPSGVVNQKIVHSKNTPWAKEKNSHPNLFTFVKKPAGKRKNKIVRGSQLLNMPAGSSTVDSPMSIVSQQ